MEYMESMMQNQLEASLIFEKQCEDIIDKLDQYARKVCAYDYGLPTYEDHYTKMKEIVRDALMGDKL